MKNFFSNILFPVRFINNILQFRFMEAGVEFGRFFINTTTSAGFADVAKGLKTVVPVDPAGEDFGQTLGRWGLGHGFYLVWPFIGPSSARDTVGRVGDLFAEPMFYLQPWELSAATAEACVLTPWAMCCPFTTTSTPWPWTPTSPCASLRQLPPAQVLH